MRFISLSLLIILAVFTSFCTGNEKKSYEMTLLHTNDIHSYILGLTEKKQACNGTQENCFGGYARLEAAIEAIKKEDPNALVLDAGDNFTGTLFYTLYKTPIVAEFMNRLGYSATVFGNHEFDYSCEEAANLAKSLNFPVLATNIEHMEKTPLAELTKPYLILTHQGRKIGLVGFTVKRPYSLSSACKYLQFAPAIKSAKSIIPELKAKGVDIIIALSHLGYDVDLKLAEKVEGIDIIVGGHSHTLLGDPSLPETAKAVGPYPTVVQSPSGDPVLIVTAKCYGEYLGMLKVSFNDQGVAESWAGGPKRLGPESPKSAEAYEKAMTYAKGFLPYRQDILGQIVGEMDTDIQKCRKEECITGDLVTDAMLEWGRTKGAVAAIIGGGALRAPLPCASEAGSDVKVNMESVMTTLPFSNTLVIRDILGSDLLAAFERSVGRAGDKARPQQSGKAPRLGGRFLQMAGISYSYDSTQPSGSRVSEAFIANAAGGWEKISPDKAYRIVLIDFNVRAGDGYSSLAQGTSEVEESDVPLIQVFGEYIKKHSPVKGAKDGRIKNITKNE